MERNLFIKDVAAQIGVTKTMISLWGNASFGTDGIEDAIDHPFFGICSIQTARFFRSMAQTRPIEPGVFSATAGVTHRRRSAIGD